MAIPPEKTVASLREEIEVAHRHIFELIELLPTFGGDASDDAEKMNKLREINNLIIFEGKEVMKLYDQIDKLFLSTLSKVSLL